MELDLGKFNELFMFIISLASDSAQLGWESGNHTELAPC
jgi:hypothetical protein